MRYCFIVACSDDRNHLLKRFIDSFKKNKLYSNADVFLYYQGQNLPKEAEDFFKDIVISPILRGVFTPRYELFKRFCMNYEFTILLDDDLFLYPDTSYEKAMAFLDFNENAGCCCISRHIAPLKNEIKCISSKMGYYNVSGGMVFPKRAIKVILDYFKDKEDDYTEDVFWLLLYVKGFDLYQDFSSRAIHLYNQKDKNGNRTGFNKMRMTKPHKPILSEWFDSRLVYQEKYGMKVWQIKELKDINSAGIAERKRNYGKTKD